MPGRARRPRLEAESTDAAVERFGGLLADAGAQHFITGIRRVADTSSLERIATEIFPHLRR